MREYIRNISDMILDSHNPDLALLRWLVSYHLQTFPDVISYDWVNSKRKEMKAACLKCQIIDDETGGNISDSEYVWKIYKYGQSVIVKYAQNKVSDFSEYSVLLYVYTLAMDPKNPEKLSCRKNKLGKALLENIKYLCEKPCPPENDFVSCKQAEEAESPAENRTKRLRSSVDRLIFMLYLWVADLGVMDEYNLRIHRLNNSKSHPIDGEKIYGLIYRLPSKLTYFYNNPKHSKETEEKIHRIVISVLSKMPPEAVPFAPSIVTILFNSLLPTKIARAEKPDAHYINMIREPGYMVNPQKNAYRRMPQNIKFPDINDSSFLKMLILPEDGTFVYDKNRKNRIETRFIEYEWICFCKIYEEIYKQAVRESDPYFYNGWYRQRINLCLNEFRIPETDVNYFEKKISRYIEGNKIIIPDSAQFKRLGKKCRDYIIKCIGNHSFPFTYVYFEMFCVLAGNKELFSDKPAYSVDIALSIIHLNAFTKWYDALLLHKGMNFSYLQCSYFFYLKMLTLDKKYQSFVADISYVDRETLYLLAVRSMKKNYEKYNTMSEKLFRQMLSFFYANAKEKLNVSGLLNIFKTDSDKKCEIHEFDGFNPIYQWIKILDDEDLSEQYFKKLTEEGIEKGEYTLLPPFPI